MILTTTLNPCSCCVPIDPIRAPLRSFTTINAPNQPCRISDAVGDLSASPALVLLAPRGVAHSLKPFLDGARRDGFALDEWLRLQQVDRVEL